MSDHPLSPQRANTDEIGGRVALAKDRRNRGPLSMISDGSPIAPVNRANSSSLVPKATDHPSSRRESVRFDHDRQRNDDYFPQGEDFEDEIGLDYGQLHREPPSRRPSREDDMDN